MNEYYHGHRIGVVSTCAPTLDVTWNIDHDDLSTFKPLALHSTMWQTTRRYFVLKSDTFTGRIASREEFVCRHGVALGEMCKCTNPTNTTPTLFSGVEAEGCLLEESESVAFTSADCYMIAVSHPSHFMVAGRAGLRSLVDYNFVIYDAQPRKYFSVVDSIMEMIRRRFKQAGIIYEDGIQDLHISLHCGISWKHFRYSYEDSVHGKANRKLVQYLRKKIHPSCSPARHRGRGIARSGHISLHHVILSQFERYGISGEHIFYHDGIDTGAREVVIPNSDKTKNNPYVSWSQGTAQAIIVDNDPESPRNRPERRNMVMVTCYRNEQRRE